ncbi:hypothetical protein DD238_000617 [Peronospora effusa]|uniref:Glucokinase n=1 Tax=Peronospora effusa TaxID=542832 RepID=A0A3M6VUR8_9STRA|nr:hypothetical protein DD238_000617 [Peronospora effusa]
MTALDIFAGVDIGGTGVKVGIVTSKGSVVAREQENYHPDKHEPQDVVDLAVSMLHKVLKTVSIFCIDELWVAYVANKKFTIKVTCLRLEDLDAIGVGCPGVLKAGGVIHAAASFPSWTDVPLQQLLTDKVGRSVTVGNDADAAILAEQWVGAAKGQVKDFIMLSFSIVANGQLVRGGSNAIEGGHMIVERNGRQCGCSQRGCLEAYTSASALKSQAQEHLRAGRKSSLSRYFEADINAELIFKHAAEGDELCKHVIHEIIVLSGGIAEAGETYIKQIRLAYAKHSWTTFPNPVRIEKAGAGYDSGIIGAVAVCKPQRDALANSCM